MSPPPPLPEPYRPRRVRTSLPALEPDVLHGALRWVRPVLRRYFRSSAHGLERLPAGQTIVVTHHDGGMLPLNGVCLAAAWYERFGAGRPLYVLTHEIFQNLPGRLSSRLRRMGLVPADREVMETLLARGESVLVLPGAARESYRPYRHRRRIDLGGRTGFVAQAIRWDLPITPVVSVGAHDTVFILGRGGRLARWLGVPRLVRSADVFPLQVGLPWGIWALPVLPHLPLPARIVTEILPPIHLDQALGRRLTPADADNPDLVQAGYRLVLDAMQERLYALYDAHRYPLLE